MKNDINVTYSSPSLLDKLYQFIKSDNNEDVEIKPNQFEQNDKNQHTNATLSKNLEILKHDKNTNINKQIYNIAENIAFSIQNLSKEKYLALFDKILLWGYEPAINTFIVKYYLEIKTDSNLRRFILVHLDKIIQNVKRIINAESIIRISEQNFQSNNDIELKHLQKKLADNEQKLVKTKINNIQDVSIDQEHNIDNDNDNKKYKEEVLEELRKNNPELEQF